MKKRDVIIYRIVTGLFTVFMLFNVIAYFFKYDMTSEMFESLGVSTSFIYPLAIAKFLGIVAIWANKSRLLTYLAYLGFAVEFILAISTHMMAKDGGAGGAAVALFIMLVSLIYNRKLYGNKAVSAEVE